MIDLLMELLNMDTENLSDRDHIINTAIYSDLIDKAKHPFNFPKNLTKEGCKKISIEAINTTKMVIHNLLNKQQISTKTPVLVKIGNKNGLLITPANQVSVAENIKIIIFNLIAQKELILERLKTCPRCNKFFYQHNRTNQKFCNSACSNYFRHNKHINN